MLCTMAKIGLHCPILLAKYFHILLSCRSLVRKQMDSVDCAATAPEDGTAFK